MKRRYPLIGQRVEEHNRLEKGPDKAVMVSLKRHIAWLTKEIVGRDKARAQLFAEVPELAQRKALYESVKGIGDVASSPLVAFMPERGMVGGKAITALAGLAPWANDSGQHRGKRGGRTFVRQALYLPMMTAVRYNPDMRCFYEGLIKRGKPGKVALMAVMRKMLVLLNSIAHRGTPWSEKYAPAQ